MYTTAQYVGKNPIIAQLEQATQRLIAARKRVTDTTFAFHRAASSNLPEKRVELVEQYTNEDRRNGNKDLRWLRYQQFMQAEALNNVGYTRTDLLAAKEEHELSAATLRAVLKNALDANNVVEGWQQGFLSNAVAFAQSVLAEPMMDHEWLQPVPGWLEELPVEDLVEKALLKALEGVSSVVAGAGVATPSFTVQSLLEAYPTDPIAVAPMDSNSKKHPAKDYRSVYAVMAPTRLQETLPHMFRMLELYAEVQSQVGETRQALNQFRAHEGSRLNEAQHKAKLHELMSQPDSTEEIARQINRQASLRLDYISARGAFRSALTLALQKRAELFLELQQAVAEALDFAQTNPVVPTREWRQLDEKDAWEQVSEGSDNQIERFMELLKQPSKRGAAICETRFQRHLATVNCLAADLLLRSCGATFSEWAEHIDDDLSNGEATKEMDRLVEEARKAASAS